MSDLINGRTPEQIKAGLTYCTTGNVPGYGCNVYCPYLNVPNCWLPVKCDALALIERLESERDAAPVVHARWVYSGYVDADGNRHANCSRCGAGEEHKEEWTDKVPYCWNCGARMDAKGE